MHFHISSLSDKQINFIIAKILGLNPLGELLCYKDPECGDIVISSDQNKEIGLHSFPNYVYVYNCNCDLMEELKEENYFSTQTTFQQKFFNHLIFCFSPIPNYFSSSWIVDLIQKFKIHLSIKNDLWIAKINKVTYKHKNIEYAILLTIIKNHLEQNLISVYDLF
jgi:hypothetical protein